MYYLDMDKFPTSEQGIEALYRRPSDEEEDSKWDGPYGDGDDAPLDPWGNEYQYEWPSTHGDDTGDGESGGREYPDIWSLGKDGEDGTDDDIINWKKEGGDGDGEGRDDMPEIDLSGEGDL
jgi:general secretion pathway protein G